MQQALSLGCVSVSWKSYRYEDVLSLVVKAEADWEFTDYAVYLYDAGRGVQLTTAELLEKLGVAQETFLTDCGAALPPPLTSRAISTPPRASMGAGTELDRGRGEREHGGDGLRRRDGQADGGAAGGTLWPGAAWYYKVLEAMPERGGETLTVEAGDVALTVGGESAQLRLEGVEETYTVGGAWSDYTAGVCAALGEDGCVYIFLLTAGGTVEYIDVTGGLAGRALCLSPLGGIGGVTALETDEEQQTVLALDGEGKRHDLKAAGGGHDGEDAIGSGGRLAYDAAAQLRGGGTAGSKWPRTARRCGRRACRTARAAACCGQRPVFGHDSGGHRDVL